METTMNNIFLAALQSEIKNAEAAKIQKEMREREFIEDMKIIKKNLEDAFLNTSVRVEMGMFGMQELKYTTIRVVLPNGDAYSGITSNKALYHCGGWSMEDNKDFRKDGQPITYERFLGIVAKRMAQCRCR